MRQTKYQKQYRKLSKKIRQGVQEFKKFCKQKQSLSYNNYIKCCSFIENTSKIFNNKKQILTP